MYSASNGTLLRRDRYGTRADRKLLDDSPLSSRRQYGYQASDEGAHLYLPIEVAGTLFSMGDGHAAQGDGEVCGTAIETPMRATVRLTVRKDIQVPEPQFLTGSPLIQRTNTAAYYATDGIAPDLLEATRKAVRHMIQYLQRTYNLSRSEAYMLCSVAVDLKISEVVDAPNWLVSAFLPQSIFTSHS